MDRIQVRVRQRPSGLEVGDPVTIPAEGWEHYQTVHRTDAPGVEFAVLLDRIPEPDEPAESSE